MNAEQFGDSPYGERAVDDLNEEVYQILQRAKRRMERLRQLGFSCAFIVGTYDPLTGKTFMQYGAEGDYYAVNGMVKEFLDNR